MALIYIVEDDESIKEIEEITFKNSNYEVESFECASSFFDRLSKKICDIVILDVMLPDLSGLDILKKLRSNPKYKNLPVIIVSAKSQEIDMIKGLDMGADDYIKKPFSVLELLSRTKALLRRSTNTEEDILMCGLITIDNNSRQVKVKGEKIDLTYKEYELLKYLLVNKGIVLSREKIMNKVWNSEYELESRTVDIHIKTLRQKLNEAASQIITVRNVGYSLSPNTSNEKEN